jgi:hypothetical protein
MTDGCTSKAADHLMGHPTADVGRHQPTARDGWLSLPVTRESGVLFETDFVPCE